MSDSRFFMYGELIIPEGFVAVVTRTGFTAGSPSAPIILPRPYFSGYMIPADDANLGKYMQVYKSPFDNQVK